MSSEIVLYIFFFGGGGLVKTLYCTWIGKIMAVM